MYSKRCRGCFRFLVGEEVIAVNVVSSKVGNLNDVLNYMIHLLFIFLLPTPLTLLCVFSKRSIYKIITEHLSLAGTIIRD